MRRAIHIFLLILIPLVSVAQNSYRLTIVRTLPGKDRTVFQKTFSMKKDLNDAISAQTATLQKTHANYRLTASTPQGRETRHIQNIRWIQVVNGKETYHSSRTYPAKSYAIPTQWTGYKCDIDGKRTGDAQKAGFIYRVAVKGNKDKYETAFVTDKVAKAMADSIYKRLNVTDRPLAIMILRADGNRMSAVDSCTNAKEYALYMERQQQIADSIENARLEHLAEQERLIRIEQIQRFRELMASISSKKDSLKTDGIKSCRCAMETAAVPIADSLFVSEGLDSLYLSVLTDDIFPYIPKKKVKTVKDINQTPAPADKVKTALLNYTRRIESIVFDDRKNKVSRKDKDGKKKQKKHKNK